MQLTFTTTPRLEALRAEVKEWLDAELPNDMEGFQWDFDEDPDRWAFYRQFWRKQGAMRWIEPTWPREFGGAEMSPRQALIVRDEFDRRRAGVMAGIHRSVGPVIMRLGTPEQKARFLPGMAGGEIMWGECYTEPDAGSDLASLRTRAVRDVDDWVISGQKTMSTAAHQCNWLIVAARTDPDPSKRHRGVTFFLVPRHLPGIEMQPMFNIAGGRQNFIFFDEVRVPADNVIGDVDKGWQQVWLRVGGDPIPVYDDHDPGPEREFEPCARGKGYALNQLLEYARTTTRGRAALAADPRVRQTLIELIVGVEIEKLLGYEEKCSYGPDLHAAISKEFEPELAQAGLDVIGPLGLIEAGPQAPLGGAFDRVYRQSFGNHAGGTSQLKRMVIATRMLGLPR